MMSKWVVVWIFFAGGSGGATSGQIDTNRESDCKRIEAQMNSMNKVRAVCVLRFE